MDEVIEPQVKQRKKLSQENLDKLQNARIKALEKRRELKKANEELNIIKIKEPSIASKKLTDTNNEIEVYKNIKNRIDNELKTNELSYLKNNMENMISKFNNIETNLNSYIEERRIKKEVKQKKKLVNELPNSISKNILNDELKRIELARFRKEMFGL